MLRKGITGMGVVVVCIYGTCVYSPRMYSFLRRWDG
jgi:hypothetical protein